MTLILSLLTQHEVIQVSDRRFTFSRGSSVVSRNDERNKAVLFCGRMIFAFTGRGDLGMKRRTDLWLAERICEVIAETQDGDQGILLRGVATKVSDLFARAYSGQRHAFVSVGWARFTTQPNAGPAEQHEFQPYLACISNFHDEHGRQLDRVQDRFSIWLRVLQPGEGGFFWDAPGHLRPSETAELQARLAAADANRAVDALAGLLTDQVLTVADRDDGVGRGLMVSVLPRTALGDASGFRALAGGPMAGSQTFLYVPPSGNTTIQLGPVATCGDSIMSEFRAEPLPPDFQLPPRAEDPPGLIRRWYLAPIVGSGTTDDPYRAETLDQGGSALIPSREDGHPRHSVALVLVASSDHTGLEADPRIQPLADVADLDLPVSKLPPQKQAWLVSAAAARQTSADGLAREVLRRIGQQLEPEFDETSWS